MNGWPHVVITLPEKGNLQLCQNYRTISLISQPSKVMLKIFLAQQISEEEQAVFFKSEREGAANCTKEQLFNLCILCKKYLSMSRISSMPSYISRRLLTGYGLKPYWQLWGNTTAMQHHLVQICMTKPRAHSCSVAAQETGSELKSESNKGVYSHQPSLTYF